MSTLNLEPLLRPRSIALVGASERGGPPLWVFGNLTTGGFPGRLYLINPSRENLFGQPCYSSLAKIPERVDLAFILRNCDAVAQTMEECIAAGVRSAVVVAEGFAEMEDPEGRHRQDVLRQLARGAGIPVCGPNCMGLINVSLRTWAYSGPVRENYRSRVRPGCIALLSQSGGNTVTLTSGLVQRNLGMAYVVSTGNEACVDIADYIEFMLADPAVRVIGAYVEGFKDPCKFRRVAEQALAAGKPIIVAKIGKTEQGQQAALAHTGSMAGSDRAYNGLFRQTGVIRAHDLEDLLDQCSLFAQIPPEQWVSVRTLGVVTSGGGAASLLSDLASEHGFQLPDIPEPQKQALRRITPSAVTVKNPVDLVGAARSRQPELFRTFMQHFMASDAYEGVLYATSNPDNLGDRLAEIQQVWQQTPMHKPIILTSNIAEPVPDHIAGLLRESGIALIMGLDRCLKSIQSMSQYVAYRDRKSARPAPSRDDTRYVKSHPKNLQGHAGGPLLDQAQAYELLSTYGITPVATYSVRTANEAVSAARRLGFPVVVKTAHPAIAHKTEIGGVHIDLRTLSEVKSAYNAVTSQALSTTGGNGAETAFVQRYVKGGVEVYLGTSNKDPIGPVILLGLGGIWVEILRDVTCRVAPFCAEDVEDMIRELRHGVVLDGVRGHRPSDKEALIGAVLALSKLASDYYDIIAEIDINPAIVLAAGQGLQVVDILVTLKDNIISSVSTPTAHS